MSNTAPTPNQTSQPTAPEAPKLTLMQKAEVGLIAVGGFLGVFHPGIIENAGAKVDEGMRDGARVALEATGTVATGVAKGAEATGAYVGTHLGSHKTDPATAKFEKQIDRKYGTPDIH